MPVRLVMPNSRASASFLDLTCTVNPLRVYATDSVVVAMQAIDRHRLQECDHLQEREPLESLRVNPQFTEWQASHTDQPV